MEPPVPPAADDFALLVEIAHSHFSTLQALIDGRLAVVSRAEADDSKALRATGDIQMALAKEFLSNVVRARRIAEHAGGELLVEKAKRQAFVRNLAHVVDVRDVNEHGFDRNSTASSRPSQHFYADEGASADETSHIVLGANKILMGPLNLADIFGHIDRMRQVAGFAALVAARTSPPDST